MAVRVTEDEVKKIIDWDGSTDIEPFITAANQIVNQVCLDSGYSDDLLKEIERWLSGHAYVMTDQTPSETKAGEATEKYQYKIGLFLKQSKQGQMAMLLDTDGNLAQLSQQLEDGENPSITVSWLGEDYNDDTDS